MVTSREVMAELQDSFIQILGSWVTETPKPIDTLFEANVKRLANARVNLELVIPEEPDTINLTGNVRATSCAGSWIRIEVVFTDLFTMVDKNKAAFFKDAR